MGKRKNNEKITKRVREKAPFGNSPGQFERQRKEKITKTKKKRKGFEKKLLLAIPQVSFKGKERKNCQHEKKTKRVREKAPFGNSPGQI